MSYKKRIWMSAAGILCIALVGFVIFFGRKEGAWDMPMKESEAVMELAEIKLENTWENYSWLWPDDIDIRDHTLQNSFMSAGKSEDGSMYMTLLAVPDEQLIQSGHPGYYHFMGCFEWLDIPEARMQDAVSLYVDGITWSQDKGDFKAKLYYQCSGQDVKHMEADKMYDAVVGGYCTFALPQVQDIEKLWLVIYKKGCVKSFTENQAILLKGRYEHLYDSSSANPDYLWDDAEGGVSMQNTKGLKSLSYTSSSIWTYQAEDNEK